MSSWSQKHRHFSDLKHEPWPEMILSGSPSFLKMLFSALVTGAEICRSGGLGFFLPCLWYSSHFWTISLMSSCNFGQYAVRFALHLGVIFGETQHHSLQSGWCQADLFLKDGLQGLVICVYDNFSPKRISMQVFASK